LVIIVQNAVPQSELGVATSGATFFRSIGGSFGTAIFGAIFANVLVGNLATHLHGLSLPPGFNSEDITPALLAHLPALVHQGLIDAYSQTIQTVFIVSVPICALAFIASWLIPHVELKRWTSPAAGETPSVPSVPSVSSAPPVAELAGAGAAASASASADLVAGAGVVASADAPSVTGIPAPQTSFGAAAQS